MGIMKWLIELLAVLVFAVISTAHADSASVSVSQSSSNSFSGYAVAYDRRYKPHKEQPPPQKYFIPNCCEPCSLLIDYESMYFQECGQYWIVQEENKFQSYYEKCINLKELAEKISLIQEVKDACFSDFSVLIQFQCPRLEVCEAVEACDVKGKKANSLADLINLCSAKPEFYCPPPPLTDCSILTQKNTMFYEFCGKKLNLTLLHSLAARCKDVEGEARKAILSMLFARCRCLFGEDKHAPDPCQQP